MDPNYSINGFTGHADSQPQGPAHSYSTPQHSSTSQRFPDQMPESNTLPPIGSMPPASQPYQHHFYTHQAGLPQTPITPQTPMQSQTSGLPSQNTYSHIQHQQAAPPRTLQPSPAHLPPVSSFSTAPSTSIAQNGYYPAVTAAAAAAMGQRSLTDLRPRSESLFPHLASQPSTLAKHPDLEPTHVVGQQGRRGILPSAPGRAPPSSGKSIVPVKDQDGKFPCPHCSKTYLHAKHLKRHMLRRKYSPLHRAERPSLTNPQIRVIDRINANCAKTRSRGATS